MRYFDLKKNGSIFLNGLKGAVFGEFKFSKDNFPTLISSALAVMLMGLLDKIKELSREKKKKWAEYLNSFQRLDGFYGDDDISPQNLIPGYTEERALFHRTRHVL